MASTGGMGSSKPYQNAASTGSRPNWNTAPDRWPLHNSQPAHICAIPRMREAASSATNTE